jgi:glucose dehydrogenase
LDILSFKLGSERLDELLVFRAVGKKDFHTAAPIRWGQIIVIDRLEGKTSCAKKEQRAENWNQPSSMESQLGCSH